MERLDWRLSYDQQYAQQEVNRRHSYDQQYVQEVNRRHSYEKHVQQGLD